MLHATVHFHSTCYYAKVYFHVQTAPHLNEFVGVVVLLLQLHLLGGQLGLQVVHLGSHERSEVSGRRSDQDCGQDVLASVRDEYAQLVKVFPPSLQTKLLKLITSRCTTTFQSLALVGVSLKTPHIPPHHSGSVGEGNIRSK